MPNEANKPSSGEGGKTADAAAGRDSITIVFEGIGTLHLPPKNEMAFLAGVGLIAAAGLIEWPVAAVVAAGHLIAHASHSKALRDFGEALETI
ncbi:hypothetical protein AB6813_15965 [bacterium RCC_150]